MPKALLSLLQRGKCHRNGSLGNASPLDEIEINGLSDNKTHHSIKSSLHNEKYGGVTHSTPVYFI